MAKQIVKKKWYKIAAPKIFNEAIVGEIPTAEPKQLVGRVMDTNLAVLTGDMKKQNLDLSLLIESVEGDVGKTKMIGLKLSPTSIKRFVRKGKSRIDQTIKLITSDEQVVSVKLLLITINIVKGSVYAAIQHEAKKFFVKHATTMDYDTLAEAMVNEKFQRELREVLSKIYPLKICEIREFKLERFTKAVDLRKIKSDLVRESKKPDTILEEEDMSEGAENDREKEPEASETENSEEPQENIQDQATEQ